jgi:hypothetical protein
LPTDGKIGTSLVAVTETQAGDAAETWLRALTAGARGWVASRPGEDAIKTPDRARSRGSSIDPEAVPGPPTMATALAARTTGIVSRRVTNTEVS